MTVTAAALLLTVLSSLGWAGFDATRKALSTQLDAAPLLALLMFGQVPFFAAWTAIEGTGSPQIDYLVPAVSTVVINVAANLLFLRGLAISPLSATIPFLSLSPMFAVLVGIPILGELPSAMQVGGIGVVVVGALAVHATGETRSAISLARAFLEERGSVYVTIVAFLWAVTASIDKVGVQRASVGLHALVQCGGVGLAMVIWLAVRGRASDLAQVRRSPRVYVLALVSATAALGFQLLAFRVMMVSLMEAIKRAIGMTLAVANGRVFFGEDVTTGRVVAVVLMSAGVAMIVLG